MGNKTGRSHPTLPAVARNPLFMKLDFALACTPPRVTKQMRKAIPRTIKGKRIVLFVDTPELKEATRQYWELFLPFAPPQPFDGPLLLKLVWHFAHNESGLASKRDKLAWMETSPDLDNMEKLLLDCLSKMDFITNDSRVALKVTAKTRNPNWQGLMGSIAQLPSLVGRSECAIDCAREMRME